MNTHSDPTPVMPHSAFERNLMLTEIRHSLEAWKTLGRPLNASLASDELADDGTWGFVVTDASRPFNFRTHLDQRMIRGRIWVANHDGRAIVWWSVELQDGIREAQSNDARTPPVVEWGDS